MTNLLIDCYNSFIYFHHFSKRKLLLKMENSIKQLIICDVSPWISRGSYEGRFGNRHVHDGREEGSGRPSLNRKTLTTSAWRPQPVLEAVPHAGQHERQGRIWAAIEIVSVTRVSALPPQLTSFEACSVYRTEYLQKLHTARQ